MWLEAIPCFLLLCLKLNLFASKVAFYPLGAAAYRKGEGQPSIVHLLSFGKSPEGSGLKKITSLIWPNFPQSWAFDLAGIQTFWSIFGCTTRLVLAFSEWVFYKKQISSWTWTALKFLILTGKFCCMVRLHNRTVVFLFFQKLFQVFS